MKRNLFPLVVLLVLASIHAVPADEIKIFGLDDLNNLGLQIELDQHVKVEGKASVRVSTRWPTTICLGVVTDLAVSDAVLIYQAAVRSDLVGSAYLEMWVEVKGKQYFSRGAHQPIKGKSDWLTLETPFVLKSNQTAQKATLNLVINGTGTVWIDRIILAKKTGSGPS